VRRGGKTPPVSTNIFQRPLTHEETELSPQEIADNREEAAREEREAARERKEQERIQNELLKLDALKQEVKIQDVPVDYTSSVNRNLFQEDYPFTKDIDDLLDYFTLLKNHVHDIRNIGAVKDRLTEELRQLYELFDDYYRHQYQDEPDNEMETKSIKWRDKIFFLKTLLKQGEDEDTYWDTDQNKILDDIFMKIQTNNINIQSKKRQKK
jgi:hypothetical protein